MKINKTLIIISLLLIFSISLGAVNAADADMSINDITDNGVATVESSAMDEEISTVSEEGQINKSSEIYENIKSATGTYNITTDYQIDTTWEITHANVIIEGNNHTIYGNGNQAFDITGNNVTIKNLNFVNCSSGGAIYFSGSGSSVSGCCFVNCSVDGGGGAIFFGGGSKSVSGCCFVNCSSGVSGGAIYFGTNDGSVGNCSFVNCSSGVSGGAIFFSGFVTTGVVGGCCFVNCSSTKSGGAIYFSSTGGNVSGCCFVNCSADSSGGAIFFSSTGGNVSGCCFVNCSADGDGGAIFFGGSGSSVSGCCFVNCSADGDGGAIYFSNTSSVNYCIFDNNKAVNGNYIFGDYSGNYDFNFFSFKNDINFPKYLIGNGKNSIIPNSWVVLEVTNSGDYYFVKFVTDEGNSLSQNMPDYNASLIINGVAKEIIIKNNDYNDTYADGNYVVTSLNTGNVLANITFNNTINCSMNVSVENITYGEDVIINVTLPSDAIGYVELYINDKYYGDSGVRGGVATFNLSDLNPGTYDIDVVYNGTYGVAINSTSFTVTAKTVNITLSNVTVYSVLSGENYTVTFTSEGEAVEGAKVIFELVNGDIKKNYTVYTNSEGKASLPINLAYTKEYIFNIYFNNTGYEYKRTNQTILVTVGNATFRDNLTDKTFNSTSMSGDNFTIQLVNGNGKCITGVYVDLDFKKGQNGTIVTYKIKTDSEGKVRLPLNLKYAGDYYLTAKYENISEDYTINILPKSTSNPSDKPTVLTNNYNDEFVTTPNSGAEIVKLTSKNVPIESAIITSNNNGEAKLAINLSDVGNIIKAIFEGNNIYAPSDESITSVEIKDTL